MAEVDIVVANRSYRLACEDGQEQHLKALAADLDAEAKHVAAQTGVVEEGKLLLMVGLMIADRLREAGDGGREPATDTAKPAAGTASALEDDAALVAALDRLEAMLDADQQS